MLVRRGHGVGSLLSAHAAALSELIAAHLEEPLLRVGVNFATFELLSAVKASGQATQIEVARRLRVTAATLPEAVKAAAAKGLLAQSEVEGDRRSKRLSLTAAGSQLLEAVLSDLRRTEEAMLRSVDADSAQVALSVLRQASANLSRSLPSQRD